MPAISQCPKCELLFAIRTQLEDHLAHDHPEFTHVYTPSSSRVVTGAGAGEVGSAAPTGAAQPVRHVLVVANQTLGGAELLDRVRARMAEGPCDFSILVPADPAAGSAASRASAGPASDDEDPATPQRRLDAARDRFARLGATVEGRVSDPNPLRAVEKAMARTPFDEVIISTLARSTSRWWRQDLPTRVQRQFHKPVTVISAVAPAGHR